MVQSLLLLSSPSTLSFPSLHTPHFLLQKPIFFSHLSAHSNVHFGPLLAQARESFTTIAAAAEEEEEEEKEGTIELPTYSSTSYSSPLQTGATVLLSAAIGVFLFRSLRRRAKRAKELRLRSSKTKKTRKEEAVNRLKAMGSASIKTKSSTPSPVQALLGSLIAGVIAVILYKFTTTIEAALNRQTVSDNFSVRQITITIRTIVNGLCYLATFVYGFNSLGLFLYSGQLALNSSVEGSMSKETKINGQENLGSLSSLKENTVQGTELTSSSREREDQSPGGKQ